MSHVMKLAIAAAILAVGMVLASSVISKFFVRIGHEQSITVKGYAEQDVVSDIGTFTCTLSERGENLKAAFVKLQHSKSAALEFLRKAGVGDAEVMQATIVTAKVPKRDEHGKDTNVTEFYDVSQMLTITSTNVARIKEMSVRITELIQDGIEIQASAPAFTISMLSDTKMALLAAATENGYQRAEALASNSHGKVGSLLSAQQGVLQITARNSTDTSGYGEYDTTTIEKTVKAVVTLEYAIERNR